MGNGGPGFRTPLLADGFANSAQSEGINRPSISNQFQDLYSPRGTRHSQPTPHGTKDFFAVSLVGLLSACGSSSPSPSAPSTPTTAAVSIPVGARTLGTSSYAPNPITVTSGTTITWTNNDTIAHTSTSDTAGVFASGSIPAGGTFTFTAQTKGTFPYHCTFHSGMVGTLVVQ